MDRPDDLFDYIENVSTARSAEEVWTFLVDRMHRFGLDRLIYGLTRYHTENGFGNLEDIMIMSTQTPEFMKEFIDSDLYLRSPMVKWAQSNVGAKSWGWLTDRVDQLGPDERAVLAFNQKMGVAAGYSISFPQTSTRIKAAIGLTARAGVSQDELDGIWQQHGREIYSANLVAHMAMSALPQATSRRSLTKRQREALQWVGDGKTTQDIAILMGLKPATVEKHLRLARESLETETTAQAVLKASVINQIYVLEV